MIDQLKVPSLLLNGGLALGSLGRRGVIPEASLRPVGGGTLRHASRATRCVEIQDDFCFFEVPKPKQKAGRSRKIQSARSGRLTLAGYQESMRYTGIFHHSMAFPLNRSFFNHRHCSLWPIPNCQLWEESSRRRWCGRGGGKVYPLCRQFLGC